MERTRTFKDWVIATRPWSLPASVTPVVAITAYLFYLSQVTPTDISWVNALLALLLMILIHSGGNMVSDYYDYVGGVDKSNCPNGVTWIYSGLFTPGTILNFGYALISVSCLVGILLLLNSSLSALWLAGAALLLALGYSWGKSHALGDVHVLLSFALLPAVGVSFVVTGNWHWGTMLLSLTYGLHTVAILHANNTRDIENDSGAGLTTLCSIIGMKASQVLYLVEILAPYVLILIFYFVGLTPAWAFLTYLTLPIAIKNCRRMMPSDGSDPQIGNLDQDTAKLQMGFGILFTLSFIISAFV